MTEKTPEEQADELLDEWARSQPGHPGDTLRKQGILTRSRQRIIRRREIPLSLVLERRDRRRERD